MLQRLVLSLLMAALAVSAADKPVDKTLELLREMGGLQEQIKGLQKSLEGKLAELSQGNADQARAVVEQTGKAVAAIGDRLQKGLQDQQEQQVKTLAAVAGLGSQLQAVSGEMGTMREAINDLTTAMTKLSTQVSDLSTLVKSAQTPKSDSGEAPHPEISATDLWASAEGDRSGGKFDLALKEYTEFVSRFGDSGQAPDAQYYVGTIHYSNKEWDEAIKAFDLLVKTHPESKRVPEALYYKGDSLNRSGQWPEANETLRDLRKRFPNSPAAKQSLGIKPLQ